MTTTTTTGTAGTSVTASVQEILDAGRHTPLTGTVLKDWAAKGTPKQRAYLLGLLHAEHASRQASRRHRLLKAAHLPALKTFEGYDWTTIRFPDDYGRQQLTDLDFLERAQDLILFGDVGTGKTHLATALAVAACQAGIPARYFTTSSLVAQLRRAKDAGRLEKELTVLAKNQLIVID
ncbi:ATP-binding protein, partial [Leekyejoonella antrihumi]